MSRRWLVVGALAACTHPAGPTTPRARDVPTPSVQVGACGEPGRDGVLSDHPKSERADRDLDGDGRAEIIVVDRNKCTAEGNCYWNVFAQPMGECVRYLGTFAAAGTEVPNGGLELLGSKGDDNMSDVRGHWVLRNGRLLLQSYHFTRGGYRMTDVLLCKQATDDRLECADSDRIEDR